MDKSISITVYPADLGAEYLSVSDAMHQMLDFVEALEATEATDSGDRQIVWRLTEAHTNSPPFSITATAFPREPEGVITADVDRISNRFVHTVKELIEGTYPDNLPDTVAAPLRRIFDRNTHDVGRSSIQLGSSERLEIDPKLARTTVAIFEKRALDERSKEADLSRVEYGSIEVIVQGVTHWYNKPAIKAEDRLSRKSIICVIDESMAQEVGSQHNWSEAWQGRRLLVGGALHYDKDGDILRIDATTVESKPWKDVSVNELRGIDILQGRSVSEHINIIREENGG